MASHYLKYDSNRIGETLDWNQVVAYFTAENVGVINMLTELVILLFSSGVKRASPSLFDHGSHFLQRVPCGTQPD